MGRAAGIWRNAFLSGLRRCEDLEAVVLVVLTLSRRLCEEREVPEVEVECMLGTCERSQFIVNLL